MLVTRPVALGGRCHYGFRRPVALRTEREALPAGRPAARRSDAPRALRFTADFTRERERT
jgi:hypothetical protein